MDGLPNDGITKNVRFRDLLLQDLKNLPSDFTTSLSTVKEDLTKDFSGLTEGLGAIKTKGMDLFGLAKDKGIDLGSMVLSGIGNFIAPGVGFVLQN